MEASLPPPSGSLGDETVRLAMSPSTPTAPPPVNRLSSAGEMGLAGVGRHPRHPPPWHGLGLWLEGDQRIESWHSLKECHQLPGQ